MGWKGAGARGGRSQLSERGSRAHSRDTRRVWLQFSPSRLSSFSLERYLLAFCHGLPTELQGLEVSVQELLRENMHRTLDEEVRFEAILNPVRGQVRLCLWFFFSLPSDVEPRLRPLLRCLGRDNSKTDYFRLARGAQFPIIGRSRSTSTCLAQGEGESRFVTKTTIFLRASLSAAYLSERSLERSGKSLQHAGKETLGEKKAVSVLQAVTTVPLPLAMRLDEHSPSSA
ncbi:MAG: hypothetical protein MK135_06280 [Polyangiaceae bacterium]|nr:hypothetical protein [Polyangiaceae bacterium]